ncbi:Nucleolar protein 13 [Beauveria bassiana]|nr:Nucleolar protein 13 [Beauveria bassiana]
MSSDDKEMSPVDASPETNSAKRKADVEEIEVDLAAPEPPSKRARRAMKKGKSATSKAKKDNDNNDLEEEETTNKDKKDDKAARSEHGVWIGNLRFTVTPQELRQWLIDNSGGVLTSEMITRVKLPLSKTPGRDKSEPATNKGFAYVDFSDIGGKVAAVALSETEWHGRRLLIKDSTSFEGRPKKEPEAKEDDRKGGAKKPAVDPNASRKIFVGNMSFKTTEDDLRRNFEKCGEIEWAKIATKRFGKDRPANAAGQRGPRQDGGDGRRHEHKKAETAEDIQTARLMGRVVEHTGSKVTFD